MNDETIDQLDETLDDLADAPSTQLWPNGAYNATVTISRLPKKPSAYAVNLTCIETIELSDPSATPPSEGDQTVMFIHTAKKDGSKNEIGQGQLKKLLMPLSAALNTVSISEILDATKSGLDAIVVVKVRKSKDAKYDDSQEIVSLEIDS